MLMRNPTGRRSRRLGVVSALASVCLLLGAVPAVAIDADVGSLPASRYPIAVPYVDVAHARILDGARRVSVAGLQGTVTHLWKVDGGYVLGRKTPRGNRSQARTGVYDLVYVTSDGTRRVITSYWRGPTPGPEDAGYIALEIGRPAMVVARSGTQIVFSTQAWSQYIETRVYSLATGTTTARRTFGRAPLLLGFADGPDGQDGQVLVSNGKAGVRWWNLQSNTLTTVLDSPDEFEDVSAEAADLTAGQYAVRASDDYGVQGIPPATTPDWAVSQDPAAQVCNNAECGWLVGPWSPDDTKTMSTGGVSDNGLDTAKHVVHRASDGHPLLNVGMRSSVASVWETNATLLFVKHGSTRALYQVVRCTLAGHCATVGPARATGTPYVLVTRRNS